VAGYDHFSEWPFSEKIDDTRKTEFKNLNVTCGQFLGVSEDLIIMSDDAIVRKKVASDVNKASSTNVVVEYQMEHVMKEMYIFKKSKLMVCCTSLTERNQSKSNKDYVYTAAAIEKFGTTTLRLFMDIENKDDFKDFPAHYGETTRVRINWEENRVFTSGSDGCINIYSIETLSDNEEDRFILDSYFDNFTSTVLIKKSKLRERELEKKELPEKREEKLKKVKADNAEKRSTLQKDHNTIKHNVALTHKQESIYIKQLQNSLEDKVTEYKNKIEEKKRLYDAEYDKIMNEYQMELASMNREIEEIRQALRKNREEHKREVKEVNERHEELLTSLKRDFEKQISDLESHKSQLEEKIRNLAEKKVKDSNTIEWLNNTVLADIQNNIDELNRGIEDLKAHNAHQIKKLEEEREKQNTILSERVLENKQISEDTEKQRRIYNFKVEEKNAADFDIKNIQARITLIENNIIEGKKRNQYLEKCKFVLDYKIKELKKEMGPIEKAIEELKKRTKDLDVELERFNREHAIINIRATSFEDLDKTIRQLKLEETKENNKIKLFKNTLFNMVNKIDDFDVIREGFKSLRDIFLKDYTPDKQDLELDAEFFNQRDNMKKNVDDLQVQLKEVKVKHVESIKSNRVGNHELIHHINKLQEEIKNEKDRKNELAADNRHANAIAAIKAQKKISQIDEMEFETMEDKIRYLEDLVQERKKFLGKQSEENNTFNMTRFNYEDGENANEEDEEEEMEAEN
jgi:hypothetical protein